jgi:hypothetical protein
MQIKQTFIIYKKEKLWYLEYREGRKIVKVVKSSWAKISLALKTKSKSEKFTVYAEKTEGCGIGKVLKKANGGI